ncbi:MAG: hypothetical protein QXM08_07265 [Thermofilaceae archaeon]
MRARAEEGGGAITFRKLVKGIGGDRMAKGVLRKGFKIHTPTLTIKIPKGTVVRFHGSTPTITFDGYPVKLIKIGGDWYADVCGTLFLVCFDRNRPPYPISYFK